VPRAANSVSGEKKAGPDRRARYRFVSSTPNCTGPGGSPSRGTTVTRLGYTPSTGCDDGTRLRSDQPKHRTPPPNDGDAAAARGARSASIRRPWGGLVGGLTMRAWSIGRNRRLREGCRLRGAVVGQNRPRRARLQSSAFPFKSVSRFVGPGPVNALLIEQLGRKPVCRADRPGRTALDKLVEGLRFGQTRSSVPVSS
jgi:hypothetical protein